MKLLPHKLLILEKRIILIHYMDILVTYAYLNNRNTRTASQGRFSVSAQMIHNHGRVIAKAKAADGNGVVRIHI